MNPFAPPSIAAKLPKANYVPEKTANGIYPQMGDLFATIYVAITTVIMVYSGLFGIYPILLLYAIWLPRIKYKGRFILQLTKDVLPLTLFGGYCLLSAAWSDYRTDSLRAALEFISMLACVVIISRIVSMEAMIRGLIIGVVLILLPVFASGSYSADGLFGSKNQVGYVAEIGFYASLIYMSMKPHRLRRRMFCIMPFALCALCIILSHSATTVASLAVVLLVSAIMYCLSKLPKSWRKFFLIMAGMIGAVVIILGYSFHLQDKVFEALGKSSDLTGRTFLWSEGIKIGMRHPLLGDGYWAFWVPGRPEAEAYWYKFDIYGKSGFHFHNLYIQTFVDLGIIGLLLMCALILSNCYKSIRSIVRDGIDLTNIFCFGFAFMYLIRAFVEVDFLQSFGIGTLLFFSLLPRLSISAAMKGAPAKAVQEELRRSIKFPTQSALAQKDPILRGPLKNMP